MILHCIRKSLTPFDFFFPFNFEREKMLIHLSLSQVLQFFLLSYLIFC